MGAPRVQMMQAPVLALSQPAVQPIPHQGDEHQRQSIEKHRSGQDGQQLEAVEVAPFHHRGEQGAEHAETRANGGIDAQQGGQGENGGFDLGGSHE